VDVPPVVPVPERVAEASKSSAGSSGAPAMRVLGVGLLDARHRGRDVEIGKMRPLGPAR
jgi:hypothetical protein